MTTTNINLSLKLEVLIAEAIRVLGLELIGSSHNHARYKRKETGDVIVIHYDDREKMYELYRLHDSITEIPEELINHLIITEISMP